MVALSLSLLSGCHIYFDIGDGDSKPPVDAGPAPDAWDDCRYWPPPPPPPNPGLILRDPYSGQCVDFNWGGWYDPCFPTPPIAPPPPWAQCVSQCSAYDGNEAACLAAPDCRAAYIDAADGRDERFIGCWATAPVKPADPRRACEELDAWDCSGRDDCSAIHESGPCFIDATGEKRCEVGWFLACASEVPVACTDDIHCGDGQRCEIPSSCVNVPECATEPSLGCADVCAGTCVPAAGSCYGDNVCDAIPPGCPPNHRPGIANGCWTGFCIPIEDCEPVDLDCRAIDTQGACLAEPQCMPIYGGLGCTCNSDGCTCKEWVYEGCIAR